MKLFYTDEKQNKRLIGEFDNLDSAAEAMLKDLNKKFCYSVKDFTVRVDMDENLIYFVNKQNKETGYTVEE